MDLSAVIFLAICTFAAGIVIGYMEGWKRGCDHAYHVGWMEANIAIRRLMARARDTTDGG